MHDIQEGCEPVLEQLKRWTGALMTRDFDVLEDVLAPDFQFTVDPVFAGGRMNKARFIELDRKIKNCSIDLLQVTARKMGDIITSLAFAQVSEEFEGDLGPDMPSASEMASMMEGAKLAYGSAWRRGADGQWRCISHHIFGFISD
jgi:ketosteroid isomerase-like protein